PALAASAPAAAPASAAPAPATQTAAGESFIGLPIVPVTATAGGTPVAELYVSAPVTTASTDAAGAHITTTLWMKGEDAADGPLYAAPNGIELGRLDSTAATKAGTPANGWVPVTIQGVVAANAVVKDIGPVWQNAESSYEFTCGACHDLHDPHEHDPAQWATEMVTMAKNANLEPPDAMLILKWLQTESLKPKAGN
ncbi:MAG: hypothetical protein P4M09_19000, partial [Devosia sp.]|nr:hypothetical protein [Devosia sp.]